MEARPPALRAMPAPPKAAGDFGEGTGEVRLLCLPERGCAERAGCETRDDTRGTIPPPFPLTG